MKKRFFNKNYIVLEIILVCIGIIAFYPIFIMLADAFKTREEMAYNPFWLPGLNNFTWDNLLNAIVKMKIYLPLKNSIIITTLSSVLIILFASMAAYPIARRKSKFYGFLYLFFLSGIIVPYQLAMIPLYKEIRFLGLINKEIGLVMVYIGIFLSFPIFFYSGFIKNIPKMLEEAAYIDGCSRYGIFFRIIFPLLKPVTATVVVLNLINIWNEFALSLLILQKTTKMTITVALYSFRGQYFSNWPHMFAGILISTLPIITLFLFAQKYFINGIVEGALKG